MAKKKNRSKELLQSQKEKEQPIHHQWVLQKQGE